MKQKFLWLLMSLCAVSFVACDNDDDDNAGPYRDDGRTGSTVTLAQAVGTWQVSTEREWKVNGAGYTVDSDYDVDEPDRIVVNADGTCEFMEYDDGAYHLDYSKSGKLETDAKGYIIGVYGVMKFTFFSITGTTMEIKYNYPDYEDGQPVTAYHFLTLTRIK